MRHLIVREIFVENNTKNSFIQSTSNLTLIRLFKLIKAFGFIILCETF